MAADGTIDQTGFACLQQNLGEFIQHSYFKFNMYNSLCFDMLLVHLIRINNLEVLNVSLYLAPYMFIIKRKMTWRVLMCVYGAKAANEQNLIFCQ